MQQGTTLFSFNQFLNANSLDDFNEKASLSNRIRCMAISGGWSDKTKGYQLKLKSSSTVRDSPDGHPSRLEEIPEGIPKRTTLWLNGNLKLPREFYYRLNKTAAKAGIDIRSTPKLRDQHVKSFIRKLTDKELRATLQGQNFRSMADLEFILKRHDETWHEETDASPSQVRDFRANNQHMRRHRPKRYGKAFVVTHSEDESEDGDYEMDSSSEGEEPPTKSDLSVPKANQSESFAKQKDACNSELRQEMPQEVFRIMDNSGWKPPNGSEFRPRSPYPRFGNFSQSKHCDNCGEGSYTTDSCWMDIECERCHQLGNSSQMCRIRLCNLCGRYHDGKCDDPKILRLLKTLAQQGQLDLKEHFSTSELNQFLDGDAGFGGEAVKPVNPLDGDPERVGLKDISQLCVLVYVAPELRSRDQDNHQYMSVIENDADLRPEMLILENQEWDSRPEFQLNPGERYGWWANHDSDKCQKEVMVHGAVNNCRTMSFLTQELQ
ncbi:hypothetical protein PHMEG_00010818 [Phytophthora megakarya]|uniref:Uncharacterized protein n=1 Tax=Phytophthora megakarya TaxID=4795 RepID=A0A225WCR3_9STRA|nr:hypothetical protein PHMEG_00010818 [Phytophthora megakarya]